MTGEQKPQGPSWVVSLDDPAALDLALVGGKGANLARLRVDGAAGWVQILDEEQT